jgi:hypothetical protein
MKLEIEMATDRAMAVILEGERQFVEFPDEHLTLTIPFTQLGDRLYRLDGVPIVTEAASFGDVIEAEQRNDEGIRFVRVAESGGWKTFDFVLSAHKIESEWGQLLLREFEARGGHWERVLGGLLFLCLPPGVDLDPTPWVESA